MSANEKVKKKVPLSMTGCVKVVEELGEGGPGVVISKYEVIHKGG